MRVGRRRAGGGHHEVCELCGVGLLLFWFGWENVPGERADKPGSTIPDSGRRIRESGLKLL